MPLGLSGTNGVQDNSGAFIAGTAVTPSGITTTFTGIPSWVKRITVMYNGLTTNGSSLPQIQLGTSGGMTTSGYAFNIGYIGSNTGSSSSSSGMLLGAGGPTSGSPYYGTLTLNLLNSSSNMWVGSTISGVTVAGNYGYAGAGSVTLSGVATQLRFIMVNATDSFTGGSVNILYE